MEVSLMTLIIQIVNFLLFATVIVKFGVGPIMKVLDTRRAFVEKELTDASEAVASGRRYEAEYEDKLRAAGEKSADIVRNAVAQAENLKKEIINDAHLSAQKIKERNLEEMELMKQDAYKELSAHVGDLAVALASKLIETSLDSETHSKMVMNFADKVESGNVG